MPAALDQLESPRYPRISRNGRRLAATVGPSNEGTGTAEDAQLVFAVGYRVANAGTLPDWKPGNEFKAKRDAMLKK